MSDTYGRKPVAEIRDIYRNLRDAIRRMDLVAADEALTEYEPFADYVFDERHKENVNVQKPA